MTADTQCLILCKRDSEVVGRLAENLRPLGTPRVVADNGPLTPGFEQLCSVINRVTSWDRAFDGIELKTTWLLEEDVAGSASAFTALADATRHVDVELITTGVVDHAAEPRWPHWGPRCDFPTPRKSFNPICRLSPALIERILEWRQRFGWFHFHELLFASLANTTFDMCAGNPLHMGELRWRPEITSSSGAICHPVKSPEIHRLICQSPFPKLL